MSEPSGRVREDGANEDNGCGSARPTPPSPLPPRPPEDEAGAYSDRVLDDLADGEALVPAIWPMEVVNVLAVAERRGRIEEAHSARFLSLLAGLPILVEGALAPSGLPTLLATARAFRLSAYDAAYLDLAMREGVAFATKDESLRAACKRGGVRVHASRRRR